MQDAWLVVCGCRSEGVLSGGDEFKILFRLGSHER